MRKLLSVILILIIVLPLSVFPVSAAGVNELYVSPDGSDDAPGTSDAPLKTVKAAKEKLKAFADRESPVTVWLRGGTYTFDETLVFDGTDRPNVTYKAYENEEVVFSGAGKITDFEDGEINGVPCFVKDVGDADIKSLFNENGRLETGRYPEEGYFAVKVLCPEDDLWNDDNTPWEFTYGQTTFIADTNDLGAEFKNHEAISVRILHYWHDEIMFLENADKESGKITLSRPSAMRIREGDRYFFENVYEAVNAPGEWYLDRAEGTLYYVPFEGESADTLTLYGSSIVQLVSVDGANGISFEKIRFENTDWELPVASGSWNGENGIDGLQAATDVKGVISVMNASDIHFTNCEFSELGGTAVKILNGVHSSSVENCWFRNIAATGVYIGGANVERGADGSTYDIIVKNNEINGYGRRFFCAIGIQITYCDTADISHNEIHDGYYTGISDGWVWGYDFHATKNIKICDNLIYDIGQGWLSDMGGIYTLGVQPGTVLSGNVIHNVAADPGQGGYGGWGIYLDEGSSEILVEKNLVFACGSDSYTLHYGKDNIITNNIFALSADSQIHTCGTYEGHNTADFTNNIVLTDDHVPVFSQAEKLPQAVRTDKNILWDVTNGADTFTDRKTLFSKNLSAASAQKKGLITNCVFTDPCFTDPLNFDFTFSDGGKAVSEYGFETWDCASAGTLKNTLIGLDRNGGQTAYNGGAKAQTLNPVETSINPAGIYFLIVLALGAAVILLGLIAAKKAVMPARAVFAMVPVVSADLAVGIYFVFIKWNAVAYAVLIGLFVLLSGLVPLFLKKRDTGKQKALAYILPAVIFAAVVFSLIFILNNVIRTGEQYALFSGFLFAELYYIAVYSSAIRNCNK